jgi:hypothetical protein
MIISLLYADYSKRFDVAIILHTGTWKISSSDIFLGFTQSLYARF